MRQYGTFKTVQAHIRQLDTGKTVKYAAHVPLLGIASYGIVKVSHIRQSMAHIRQSVPHIRQSMAHIRQSDTGKTVKYTAHVPLLGIA